MEGGFIRGVVGRVHWSYYVAAAINGYTVARSKDNEWSLRGAVVRWDAFKIRQRPLVFVAPYAKGEMRWPILDVQWEPNHIRATLGPPEH